MFISRRPANNTQSEPVSRRVDRKTGQPGHVTDSNTPSSACYIDRATRYLINDRWADWRRLEYFEQRLLLRIVDNNIEYRRDFYADKKGQPCNYFQRRAAGLWFTIQPTAKNSLLALPSWSVNKITCLRRNDAFLLKFGLSKLQHANTAISASTNYIHANNIVYQCLSSSTHCMPKKSLDRYTGIGGTLV